MRNPIVWVVGLCLLAAGCAVTPPQGGEAGKAGKVPEQAPKGPPEGGPQPSSAAVQPLVAQAESASGEGDHDRAAALLERALRIEPRNAALWQNLAVVRYRQGRNRQAENLAERSNSLADGNTELKRRNWALIAAVRRLMGDEAGARKAEARRQSLESDN
ncbi:MAG TPA: tetratricopeptide repeat protein [Gammaproteobacteria bacterium]|nr:tetratricopeptide repeat protein [Gammaproteobacteria bacterium]